MNRLKKWIKENVVECIGIIGGTIAIAIIIVFGFILISDRDKPESPTSEKSAGASITAGLQQQIEKDTTTKDSNTNTSLETSEEKTKEEEGTSLEDESTILDDSVKNSESIVQPATRQPQTKVINNQTTKASSQQRTTKQQQTTKQPQTTQASTTKPTVTAPVRGKNGVILEKLYMDIYTEQANGQWAGTIIPVPQNNDELIAQTGVDTDDGSGIGYRFEVDCPTVKYYKSNVFKNDIYVGKTNIDYLEKIYGKPYKIDNIYNTYIYRYGKINNSEKDNIYIGFRISEDNKIINCILILNGTGMEIR